jgi:hypothetical protein
MPTTKEKRQMYRSRIKTSKCRGVPPNPCKTDLKDECKYTNGRVRQFCRKKFNTRSQTQKLSTGSSSADSRFSMLNLRKMKDIVNDRRLIKTRIQPTTQKRRGIKDFFGLDDFRESSSVPLTNKLFKKPLAFKGKQPAKQNMNLDDNNHSF